MRASGFEEDLRLLWEFGEMLKKTGVQKVDLLSSSCGFNLDGR